MNKLKYGNVYSKTPAVKDKEIFDKLVSTGKFKIERIVSRGQATKPGKWLKEPHDEWVLILKGAGKLKFRKGNRTVKLKIGDYLFIPANTDHRVEWTPAQVKTIWLAVHGRR